MIEANFPEVEEETKEDTPVSVITPNFKVVSKKEGTALDSNPMAKLGMFRLYSKEEERFYPVSFTAIPLFWAAYEWQNKYIKGQPPFAVSVHDLTTSLRWHESEKAYFPGDTVRNLDKYETGVLVWLLLEDGTIVRMLLKRIDMKKFKEYVNKVKPFTPTLFKSKKIVGEKGTFYAVEFEEGDPLSINKFTTNLQPLVDSIKEEVEDQEKRQRGE